MTATVLSETILPQLPSASGVEIIGATAYIVSDDAPYLYRLDAATLAAAPPLRLFESAEFGSGRIPKATKPDLESMAAVPGPDGTPSLLLFGSGSGPRRCRGYLVSQLSAATPQVQPLDLTALYQHLGLPAAVQLNIEAAATTATELLLLQRTVGGGPCYLLSLPLADTLVHLQAPGTPPPAPTRCLPLPLPVLDGWAAGLSGATFLNGRLYVTASVEATADAVLDGTVLGSFVGCLDLATATATFARLLWADGRPYLGKVEGLAVRRQLPETLELLLVTDDDQGGSTALHAVLREG